MGKFLLVKKGIKKHKLTLFAISILLFLIFLSIIISITIYDNSGSYVKNGLEEFGYGDITAWVSNVNNYNDLQDEIEKIDDVQKVEVQELIYSGFTINGTHSDNEGQILNANSNYNYNIISNDMKSYITDTLPNRQEIYISPSMKSSYDVEIGDIVTFELSRTGEKIEYKVSGYFEDPFMGSSMIDMKSFLINEQDFLELQEKINNLSVTQATARNGAMLHIFQDETSSLNVREFNIELNTHTNLGNYTEFIYTQDTIYSFMMILQNIFIGFLIAFVIILLIVSIIVISNSISNTIDNDKEDFAILKTIGYSSKVLRNIQMMQYALSICIGLVFSFVVSIFIIPNISSVLITSTGFIMKSNIPINILIGVIILITCFILLVVYLKTIRISKISPIEVLRNEENTNYEKISGAIGKELLSFDIAVRQVVSNKRKYIGTFCIAILLTFFVLVVGRLNSWVGANGEGLMNTFSVADHDLGVEPKVHVDMNEVQNIIKQYSKIQKTYSLAMRSVNVNGVSYTANIISDTNWFHILVGERPKQEDEIVVTEMVANDLSVNIGDTVTINHESRYSRYKIVGIYQCANSMGANIGMSREGFSKIGNVNSYIWCYHFILEDHTHNEEIMKILQDKYSMQMDVHTNSWSGLDGIVETLHLLVIFMYIVVIIFILVTIGLTTSKILNFEKKDMGIYKAIGFTSNKLRWSFAIRFLGVSFIGSMIGMIFSILFADKLIEVMLKTFGIGEFVSLTNIINTILPVITITLLFTLFSYIFSRKIKKINLINLIKGG